MTRPVSLATLDIVGCIPSQAMLFVLYSLLKNSLLSFSCT